MKRSMNGMILGWMAVVGLAAGVGCGMETDGVLGEEYNAQAELDADKADGVGGAPTYTYYRVRRDFRRCMFPMCGGWWVKRVNVSTTRCLNGTYASECYVTDIDYSALRLSSRALDSFKGVADKALLRGYIAAKTINGQAWGVFKTTEGWQSSSSANEPTGTFRRLQDNGVRCFTHPCYSIHAARLNEPYHVGVSGVDLRRTGAPTAEQNKAHEQLMGRPGGIMASGTLVSVPNAGPAGAGRDFRASQFYLKVGP